MMRFLFFILFILSGLFLMGSKGLPELYLDFSNIKEILKNDMLEEEIKKKREKRERKKRRQKKMLMKKYFVPDESTFWPFASEYWLVKNLGNLKWDFARPNYGITQEFEKFLSSLELDEKRFQILFLKAENPTHFVIPGKDQGLFLLSTSFLRSADLTVLEIALLLFEDYLRFKEKFFHQRVMPADLKKMLGHSFYKEKKIDRKLIDQVLKNYSKMVFEEGFSFKEQFSVTKRMKEHLKNRPRYQSAYRSLLKKIDVLVKEDKRYRHYLKTYPSPELQLGWFANVKKKVPTFK